jgi:hypothetical protein
MDRINQPGPGPIPGPGRQPQPQPATRQVSAADATLEGAYATNLVIMSSREEFMVDFMSVFPPKPRIVARIVLAPAHVPRVLRAMQDALEKYEKPFGPLPELVPTEKPKTQTNLGEFYNSLRVPDEVVGGVFSNYLEISQRKDDFLLDFQTNFPPVHRLNARVIVPAPAFKRMIPVVINSIKSHEQRFGPIEPGGSPPPPPAAGGGGFTLN